ncbi:MAG: 2-iminoacetate synthase ThiH [Leptospiraceae bacterium]|nr:2-iminoacetate synthase ThiH [Leptospiraceae bacterium]MCP5501184.1 2-iminoacetate synthase ThiH [Leptospiraceae bacterium]
MFLEEVYSKYSFQTAIEAVQSRNLGDVEQALNKACYSEKLSFGDYLSLISPLADSFLENMAELAHDLTLKRFGKTIQLFMPLYLSNECRSSCVYCGFSYENKIPRKTLHYDELEKEAEILKSQGLEHVLILTGEAYSKTPVSYIAECTRILRKHFSSIAIEIYPMDIDRYKTLIEAGVDGLTLYQETYDPDTYKEYHLRGMKKNMEYRLNAPDRGGMAGFRKISLGTLLGLSHPLGELFFLGLHLQYMYKTYWKTFLQASLPRMRPAKGGFQKVVPVSDREFLRFILALRLMFPDLGLTLSTRETPDLRDNLVGLGITSFSAGSKTEPGGYQGSGALEQFEIEDKRRLEEVIEMIRSKGYDPVIKDFDRALL